MIRRVLVLLPLFIAVLATPACGGKSESPSAVTITPANPSVATSETLQFSASVAGATETSFNWQVNGIAGGNLSVGTISPAGLFTAPGVIPSGGSVTVRAISQSDTSKSGSVKVTITQGQQISVTISPTSATVRGGQSQQFTATVTPSTNSQVTWQVNDVNGGSSANGFISSNGFYTAPQTVPENNVVTITAVSASDTSKKASAQVTILPPAVVQVTPANPAVAAGGEQQFTATVNGQPVVGSWQIHCRASAGGCGTITQDGLYTAPRTPPNGDVNLVVTPADSTVPPGGAVIRVHYANGSLQGQYAFSFFGQDSSRSPFAEAGSLTFDGNGGISGGVIDSNYNTFSSATVTGGTYQIGSDGRGQVTIETGSGTSTWRVVLVNHMRILATRSGQGGVLAGGTVELQHPNQFTLGDIQGGYAFCLAGAAAGEAPGSFAMAGALTADGSGNLSAGRLDVNAGGTLTPDQPASGSYTAPDAATGRGELTLSSGFGNQTFAYYIVDGTRLKLLETSASLPIAGEMARQPDGPFSISSFQGGHAFVLPGAGNGQPWAMGGVVTLDGIGNVSGGTADINSNGTFQSFSSLSGAYAVTDAATGRTTLTLTVGGVDEELVFYPQSGGVLSFLVLDDLNVAAGSAYAQTGQPVSLASIRGKYAIQLSGADFAINPGPEEVIGLLEPNGGGAITGAADILTQDTTAFDTPLLNSSYGLSFAMLRTGSSLYSQARYRLYVVNPGLLLFLESLPPSQPATDRLLTGTMRKQD